MGDDIGGGSTPQTGADSVPVDTHGTARDFGNMLNAYMPKHKKLKHGDFSPWTKMLPKKQEKL